MANISSSQGQLADSWRRLQQRWEETKSLWNDPVQRDFESQFWVLLESELPSTLREFERLAHVISHAQQSIK